MNKLVLCIVFLFHCAVIQATNLNSPSEIPKVSEAFSVVVDIEDNQTIHAYFNILADTYLYQSKLIIGSSDDSANLEYALPKGELITDPFFGEQEIYRESIVIPLTIKHVAQTPQTSPLTIEYQGCHDVGFCYPPQKQQFQIHSDQGKITQVLPVDETSSFSTTAPKTLDESTIDNQAFFFSAESSFGWLILSAFGIGILLSFTPCVLPMLPILSGLIVGQSQMSTLKAFTLSVTYVIAMSLTYAVAGVIAAIFGHNLQAYMQHPVVLSVFAGLFFLLGLYLLDKIHFPILQRVTAFFQSKQQNLKGGSLWGAALLGITATLVASPCVTAPMAGTLAFIAQSQNVLLGGSMLLAMGLGMGVLLIVAGTLGGKFLPKAGNWMYRVNQCFAIVLFALGIFLISRFLPPFVTVALSIGLCFIAAVLFGTLSKSSSGLWPKIGMLPLVYACLLVFTSFKGLPEIDAPYQLLFSQERHTEKLTFHTVSDRAGLYQALNKARASQQPVFIEYWAQWCSTCQQMDKTTLQNPKLQAELQNWYRIKVDITNSNAESRALLKEYSLSGPPTVILLDSKGRKITTLAGYQSSVTLINAINSVS